MPGAYPMPGSGIKSESPCGRGHEETATPRPSEERTPERRVARRHIPGRFSALDSDDEEESLRQHDLERGRKARVPPSRRPRCRNTTEGGYSGYSLPPQLFPTLQYGRRTKLYKPNLQSTVRAAEPAAQDGASAAPTAVGTASAATAPAAKALSDWESAGIKFPDNSNKWKCGTCLVRNKRTNARCVCCSTLSPEEILRAAAPTPVPAPTNSVSVSACAPVLVTATSTSSSGGNNMPEPMMWSPIPSPMVWTPTPSIVHTAGNMPSPMVWSPIPSNAHTAGNMVATTSGTCHGGYMARQHFQAQQLQMQGQQYVQPQLQQQPVVGVAGGWDGATGGQLGLQSTSTASSGTVRQYAVPRRPSSR
ncbi:hypothetical protein BGZ58_004233, partial [Dissophora ornata]